MGKSMDEKFLSVCSSPFESMAMNFQQRQPLLVVLLSKASSQPVLQKKARWSLVARS